MCLAQRSRVTWAHQAVIWRVNPCLTLSGGFCYDHWAPEGICLLCRPQALYVQTWAGVGDVRLQNHSVARSFYIEICLECLDSDLVFGVTFVVVDKYPTPSLNLTSLYAFFEYIILKSYTRIAMLLVASLEILDTSGRPPNSGYEWCQELIDPGDDWDSWVCYCPRVLGFHSFTCQLPNPVPFAACR